ncbi:MAG: outer membrane protein transport protein [Paracoccaceae bacterium]
MKTQLLAAAAVTLSAASAHAVGLDRSGQRIGVLFETGNLVELSFGFTDPHLSGTGIPAVGGAPTGNVADSFAIASFGLKYDVSDELSLALILDEPYGTDVLYGGDPALTVLGGTGATADSYAITALARYKFNENFSVHGGLRYQEISASVTTAGFAFNGGAGPGVQAGVNGYSGRFGSDGDFGYVIGASYEIPDIALRVSLTYNSETVHDLPTVETLRGGLVDPLNPSSVTEVTAPESVNLSFQSGVAKDTLVFGSIRYARYSDTDVSPAGFTGVLTGNSLTDLEDGFDYEIGVGRKFNDKWSGSVTIGFSTVGDDNLVSPLAPTNGSRFISVGGRYNVNDSFAVSGGIRYTALGSAFSAPGGTPVAFFDSNSAVSAGVRFTYNF